MTITKLIRTGAVLLAMMGAAAETPLAHADNDPYCAFSHSCSWSPKYNGRIPDTSNVPGTYGGWTTNRVQCSPVTLRCYQAPE